MYTTLVPPLFGPLQDSRQAAAQLLSSKFDQMVHTSTLGWVGGCVQYVQIQEAKRRLSCMLRLQTEHGC